MGQSGVEGENVYVLCFRILIFMFRVFTFELGGGGTIWLRGEIILQVGGNKFILPSKEIYSHILRLKSQIK